MKTSLSLLLLVVLVLSATLVSIASAVNPDSVAQRIESAGPSATGKEALAAMQIPAGMQASVAATEPLIVNPVTFCFDKQGRMYVIETFRQERGVEDNRKHPEWLDDDLAAQSVEDRLAYYKKHLGDRLAEYENHGDRVRQLRDQDGDGAYDISLLFAGPYQEPVEGTAAGLLSHQGNIFLTNIPRLWKLRDTDDDGHADEEQALHYGYGVRTAFRGHDMHGLCVGPLGRIYYSIGDRGYNVTHEGQTHKDPESGAVFRCNPDGSQLEVFATGLRNPQELAFNDYGDLFTGDNNSDSGDAARWVHVVERGDSGWRMAYQYLGDRGPFNREKLWHLPHAGQSAAIVPPVAHVSSGPSGLTCYPGAGFGPDLRDTFFLCDFRGGAAQSQVLAIKSVPQGAGYTVEKSEPFLRRVLATDVDFGLDGGLYVSDWVDGWVGTGAGRIYRVVDPKFADSDLVRQTQALLMADLTTYSAERLTELLSHNDRRVRQQAQFALVAQQDRQALHGAVTQAADTRARVHGVWGLGQLALAAPQDAQLTEWLLALLSDPTAEVRAQAARVLGEIRAVAAEDALIAALSDDNARVQYFAAMGLYRVGSAKAIQPLLAMLVKNNNQDLVLRHAGIMGLVGSGDAQALAAEVRRPSAAARIALVVALRKLHSPLVADFLGDSDPFIVADAARAIYDTPIPAALESLAALITRPTQSDPLMRRVLAANYRLGGETSALRLAEYAARADGLVDRRNQALDFLASWAAPSPRDAVVNMWRPIPARGSAIARAALQQALPALLQSEDAIRTKAASVAASLGITEVAPTLVELFNNKQGAARTRAAALTALAALDAPRAATLVQPALSDSQPLVRAAGRRALARRDTGQGIAALDSAAEQGTLAERQDALAALAELKQPAADTAIVASLDRLVAGQVPADTLLDVLDAATARNTPEMRKRLAAWRESQAAAPHGEFAVCLTGGDAEKGRTIFFTRAAVSCVRCHQVDGVGGDVGPNLSKIAEKRDRNYLLESLIHPSAKIAEGFATQNIATIEGKVYSGIVRHEDDAIVRLITPEAELIEIAKDEIDERDQGKSAMPDDVVKQLSRQDIRDLVEFLSGRK